LYKETARDFDGIVESITTPRGAAIPEFAYFSKIFLVRKDMACE
jgi:hypothetical protein